MRLPHLIILAAVLGCPAAWAQQAQPITKTTEQQARSYILSAFMTGAAPAILSETAKVDPGLRLRLGVPAEADSRAVYYNLVRLTAGKSLTVRPAKIDELDMTQTQVEPTRPVFSLDVSDSTFVLQYDLEKDSVTTLADATRPVAVTAPVTAPTPPQPIADSTEAAKPAAEPATSPAPELAPALAAPVVAEEPAKPAPEAVTTTAPEPAAPAAPAAAVAAPEPAKAAEPEPQPGARVQTVEPREPRLAPPAPAKAAAPQPAPVKVSREQPRLPPLKPNGACVIKPVMSDQDLVNCGATPR
jgi:hypothetical protein